jgi:O-antigen/teichoic acid export membrane protein
VLRDFAIRKSLVINHSPMTTKKIVAHNALWNWAGIATHMLVGFFIAPFLVHRLGDSTYGLWIVIASLTTYFGVLDFGVGGSVGRNVAFFRARDDLAGVNGILSTAFFYLCVVAVVALLATVGILWLFFLMIDVPPEQQDAARLALALVGLNFALSLPLQTFDAVLWAYQRFDFQNGVDIPNVLLRAALTYCLIGAGHGLVALALITILTNLLGLSIKMALALRVEPRLRIGPSHINRESAKGLFGYGSLYFVYSLMKTIGPQLMVMIVGSRLLGTALLTPFSIAMRLISYAHSFLIAGTGVLTPVATALHAQNDQDRQRALLISGGRACFAMALMFVALFVFLGKPLIRLWMGPPLEFAYPLLLILMAGELLPMSQHITDSMILGRGRLSILAGTSILETASSCAAPLLLAGQGYGLVGVCLAAAIPAAICRGLCPLVFVCRAVGVPLASYLRQVILPALLVVAGPIWLLGAVTSTWSPSTWPELFACGTVYAIVHISVASVGLFGFDAWRAWARRVSLAHLQTVQAFPLVAPNRLLEACMTSSAIFR